jgi:hypothetical protein
VTEHHARIGELLRKMQHGPRGLTIESSHSAANSALVRAATAAASIAGYHVLAVNGSQFRRPAPPAQLRGQRDAAWMVADLAGAADRLLDRLLELTATAPVLIAVDHGQALDAVSTQLLQDTLRRLPPAARVGVLIATIPGETVALQHNMNPRSWSRHTFGKSSQAPSARRAS